MGFGKNGITRAFGKAFCSLFLFMVTGVPATATTTSQVVGRSPAGLELELEVPATAAIDQLILVAHPDEPPTWWPVDGAFYHETSSAFDAGEAVNNRIVVLDASAGTKLEATVDGLRMGRRYTFKAWYHYEDENGKDRYLSTAAIESDWYSERRKGWERSRKMLDDLQQFVTDFESQGSFTAAALNQMVDDAKGTIEEMVTQGLKDTLMDIITDKVGGKVATDLLDKMRNKLSAENFAKVEKALVAGQGAYDAYSTATEVMDTVETTLEAENPMLDLSETAVTAVAPWAGPIFYFTHLLVDANADTAFIRGQVNAIKENLELQEEISKNQLDELYASRSAGLYDGYGVTTLGGDLTESQLLVRSDAPYLVSEGLNIAPAAGGSERVELNVPQGVRVEVAPSVSIGIGNLGGLIVEGGEVVEATSALPAGVDAGPWGRIIVASGGALQLSGGKVSGGGKLAEGESGAAQIVVEGPAVDGVTIQFDGDIEVSESVSAGVLIRQGAAARFEAAAIQYNQGSGLVVEQGHSVEVVDLLLRNNGGSGEPASGDLSLVAVSGSQSGIGSLLSGGNIRELGSLGLDGRAGPLQLADNLAISSGNATPATIHLPDLKSLSLAGEVVIPFSSSLDLGPSSSVVLAGDASLTVSGGLSATTTTFSGLTTAPWHGLYFRSGATGSLNQITIKGGGKPLTGEMSAMVVIASGEVAISGSRIEGSVSSGLAIEHATPTLSDNHLLDHQWHGVVVDGATGVTLDGHQWEGNGRADVTSYYGLYATNGASGSAVNSYWGSLSGPAYHPSVPAGRGDGASSSFVVDPWVGKLESDSAPDLNDSGDPGLGGSSAERGAFGQVTPLSERYSSNVLAVTGGQPALTDISGSLQEGEQMVFLAGVGSAPALRSRMSTSETIEDTPIEEYYAVGKRIAFSRWAVKLESDDNPKTEDWYETRRLDSGHFYADFSDYIVPVSNQRLLDVTLERRGSPYRTLGSIEQGRVTVPPGVIVLGGGSVENEGVLNMRGSWLLGNFDDTLELWEIATLADIEAHLLPPSERASSLYIGRRARLSIDGSRLDAFNLRTTGYSQTSADDEAAIDQNLATVTISRSTLLDSQLSFGSQIVGFNLSLSANQFENSQVSVGETGPNNDPTRHFPAALRQIRANQWLKGSGIWIGGVGSETAVEENYFGPGSRGLTISGIPASGESAVVSISDNVVDGGYRGIHLSGFNAPRTPDQTLANPAGSLVLRGNRVSVSQTHDWSGTPYTDYPDDPREPVTGITLSGEFHLGAGTTIDIAENESSFASLGEPLDAINPSGTFSLASGELTIDRAFVDGLGAGSGLLVVRVEVAAGARLAITGESNSERIDLINYGSWSIEGELDASHVNFSHPYDGLIPTTSDADPVESPWMVGERQFTSSDTRPFWGGISFESGSSGRIHQSDIRGKASWVDLFDINSGFYGRKPTGSVVNDELGALRIFSDEVEVVGSRFYQNGNALFIENNSPTVRDCEFVDNYRSVVLANLYEQLPGLPTNYVRGDGQLFEGQPVMRNLRFEGGMHGIEVYLPAVDLLISNAHFSGVGRGLQINGGDTGRTFLGEPIIYSGDNGVIDIRNAFWGHPSGPDYPGSNDEGEGAAIEVRGGTTPLYDPWVGQDNWLALQSPEITPPADLEVEATAPESTVDLGSAVVSDSVDQGLVATANPAGPYAVGDYTITWSVTDSDGNQASATQQLSVIDTTPPQLTAPPDLERESSGGAIAVDLGQPLVNDLVDLDQVTLTAIPAGPYAVGSHTITWEAVDSAGNSATAIQQLVVSEGQPDGGTDGDGAADDSPQTINPSFSFQFEPRNGVALDTLIESASIEINGMGITANLTIEAGEYAISTDQGTSFSDWSSEPGTLQDGHWLKVRHLSANQYNTAMVTRVVIGGIEGQFSTTTINHVPDEPIFYPDTPIIDPPTEQPAEPLDTPPIEQETTPVEDESQTFTLPDESTLSVTSSQPASQLKVIDLKLPGEQSTRPVIELESGDASVKAAAAGQPMLTAQGVTIVASQPDSQVDASFDEEGGLNLVVGAGDRLVVDPAITSSNTHIGWRAGSGRQPITLVNSNGSSLAITANDPASRIAMRAVTETTGSLVVPEIEHGEIVLQGAATGAPLLAAGSSVIEQDSEGESSVAVRLQEGGNLLLTTEKGSARIRSPIATTRDSRVDPLTTIHQGETAAVDQEGQLVSIRLGSMDANRQMTGDRLPSPHGDSPVSEVKHLLIDGFSHRLQANVGDTLCEQLSGIAGEECWQDRESAIWRVTAATGGTLAGWPTGELLVDPGPDELRVDNSGSLLVRIANLSFRVVPAIIEPASLMAELEASGITLQQIDGNGIVRMSGDRGAPLVATTGWQLGLQQEVGSGPGISVNGSGEVVWQSASGEWQLLHPVFADPDRLQQAVAGIAPAATLSRDSRGRMTLSLDGEELLLTPGFQLVPADGHEGLFWQGEDGRFYLSHTKEKLTDTADYAQPFTVEPIE